MWTCFEQLDIILTLTNLDFKYNMFQASLRPNIVFTEFEPHWSKFKLDVTLPTDDVFKGA